MKQETDAFERALASAWQQVESDPDLVAWMVRDFPETNAAGLKDLAWSMTQQGNNTPADARYLLEELEKREPLDTGAATDSRS